MKDKNNSKGKTEYKFMPLLISVAVCFIVAAYLFSENTIVKTVSFLVVVIILLLVLTALVKKRKLLERIFKIINRSFESCDIESSLADVINEKNELIRQKEISEKKLQKYALADWLKRNQQEDSDCNLLTDINGEFSIIFIAYRPGDNGLECEHNIKSLAEKTFADIAQIFFSKKDSADTLCIVADVTDKSSELTEQIESASKNFINELKRQFNIDADVVYGQAAGFKENANAVYRKVKEAAFLCRKDGCIINADKIAERSYEAYNYSVDEEINIIIYIKKGDFTRAYGLIRNELDVVLYQKSFPVYIIKCFMFEIAATILKAVGEIEKENGIELGCSNKLNEIFYTDSIVKMEAVLKTYLEEVCLLISEKNKGVASPFCEKVKQYVRENYMDFDMNVNAIAARFYVNPAYLSNMFKRNTDIKLLDYINKVRIDEAKKILMANPDIPIEELSEKSGFKNSRTFRRIFMKFEEVSPSQFTKK